MNRFCRQFLYIMLLALVTTSISSSAFAMTSKPPIVLPEGSLDATQIEQLFSGNTFVATIEDKGKDLVFFFGNDGAVTRVSEGWQRDGRWEAREDGRLCIDLEGANRDCRLVVKQGDRYRQYAVKKNGNHRYEMTYSDPRQGNQLAKMSNEPLLPRGTLQRAEVVKLFSGKTVESVTATKKRVSRTYYNPDGTLEQLRNGMKRQGKWRVKKDSRICLQIEDLDEKCRIIVEENGEIKKYIVKKSGRHQHSVSYRNFTPGKTFK